MSKSEEILEQHLPDCPNGAVGYLSRKQRRALSLAAINAALEWAAQQCEPTALGCNPDCHREIAKAIRRGKSTT